MMTRHRDVLLRRYDLTRARRSQLLGGNLREASNFLRDHITTVLPEKTRY